MLTRCEPDTLGACLLRAAGDRGAPALVIPPERVGFDDLLEGALVVARGLRALGVRAGDRVGILLPNCTEWVEALFGAALLGAVSVPVNVRCQVEELAYVFGHAQLRALLTAGEPVVNGDLERLARRTVDEAAPAGRRPPVAVLAGLAAAGSIDRPAWRLLGEAVAVEDVLAEAGKVSIGDVATMLYTSGTTAKPKGCLLSHEAIVRTGIARFEERAVGDGPLVVWSPCPLFHVGALVPLAGCVAIGATFVSMARFEPNEALRLLEQERVTVALPLFPAFTDAMMDAPDFATTDLSSLQQILTTGPPRGVARAQQAFAPAELVSGYGMTELCGVAASSGTEEPPADRLVWDGRPFEGIEIRIVDPVANTPVVPGETGEIVARGYCVCRGYHDDPDATRAAFDAEGWFHTGDMGVAHRDGRVAYRGRFKDMLKVGGENVSALEVESFLARYPGVRRVEVVGAPDDRLEEVVAAFVEAEPGEVVTVEDLLAHCKGRIARFKIPRHIWFVTPEEWPMSATKVDKVALRARARAVALAPSCPAPAR